MTDCAGICGGGVLLMTVLMALATSSVVALIRTEDCGAALCVAGKTKAFEISKLWAVRKSA